MCPHLLCHVDTNNEGTTEQHAIFVLFIICIFKYLLLYRNICSLVQFTVQEVTTIKHLNNIFIYGSCKYGIKLVINVFSFCFVNFFIIHLKPFIYLSKEAVTYKNP